MRCDELIEQKLTQDLRKQGMSNCGELEMDREMLREGANEENEGVIQFCL
jgi:hypothetical protein